DDQRRASHTLVETEEAAQEVAQRLEAGESFEALAAEFSVDTDTAEQGGDLGWIERGTFMEQFERALFALDEGAVSDPVRTGFGWHVIRADEVRADEFPSFDEMRDELVDRYRARAGEQHYHDLIERMDRLAFDQPDSLQPIADQLDLEIHRVEGVTRDRGTGLLADAALRRAV